MRRSWIIGAVAAALALPPAAQAAGSVGGYHLADKISGPDGGWDYAAVDAAAHRLYVARAGGVMALDLRTGVVTPSLVKLQRGHIALPIPGTTRVLATDGAANTAILFDGVTGTVIATLPCGKKPDAAAWDPATRTVWVMNGDSGDATVIDPMAAKVVATVPIGGALEFAAADGEGRIYVNVEDKNELAAIDTRERRFIARFALKGCDSPSGLAYAADARLLISACANGVAKLTTREGVSAGTLVIGQHPDATLYDERRHMAFIPAGGDGTLTVIRTGGAEKAVVVGQLATAKGVRTGALDTSTGRIYLPSADQGPPTKPGGWPSNVPGTFKVLVVAP